MRAWERASSDRISAKADQPSAMMSFMFIAFQARARYWQALGKKRPGVCQFALTGAEARSWYVVLSDRGAEIVEGAHIAPDVEWKSDADAFVALMRKEAGAELLHAGRVVLRGDLDLLSTLFEGLKARV